MALTTSIRGTPGGFKMEDGYQTLIAFSSDLVVALYELTVQPIGLDGGDMIDITTMHNVTYRTFSPRQLITATDSSFTAGYDALVLDEIVALLNVNQSITINHPSGDTWDFFGFLRTFEPQSNEEGSFPTANCVISPTNVDPVTKAETAPNFTTALGTD